MLSADRYLDIAVAEPPHLEWNVSVGDGLLADIVPRSVIDLAIRPLVDPQNQNQAAARLQLPAGHPLALECQLLTLARLQQVTMHAVFGIARAKFVSRIEQVDIVAARQ